MLFSDLALSQRLERTEGFACSRFAEAQRLLSPTCGAEWIESGGAYAVFNGVDSPVTQSFGLGLFEQLTPESLQLMENFFLDRGTAAVHEVSPFAGVAALDLLCRRNYSPVELSSVLYRSIEDSGSELPSTVNVRITRAAEAELWASISARGWAGDHPELLKVVQEFGRIVASAPDGTVCFLAESDGQPGAAGVLVIHEGVALLGGSSTVPHLRRRGLQAALLAERMRYAHEQGCDLTMIVTEPGSNSQRNAERKGFQIAYTRTKWKLEVPKS